MTISPDHTCVRLPTQPEASARWVALDLKPAVPLSKQPCRCDPNSLGMCSPCAMRDEIAWKRKEAAA